ncbi:YcgN family cysteine cluster protein [Parendozoicomonas haliclonae]|uniref:UPF0260 protein EHSB41UT_03628 n=1 Tax=Parendozoicomonas haliclonae TaxID=1960125 RepID=A0A1X7AP08_9GAMM|nr:YcgN family cysteine cluster protein [Parendozoicomonas haliclonae]SMA49838.1 hypothetical protein EHSB41UT_03628 [Parendozoicomonas haliclonae]
MAEVKGPFWHTKTLTEMTREEWDSLCDGCGRCCLNKLIDEDDNVQTTAVACKLLDLHSCQCQDFANRWAHVPDCIRFTPENLEENLMWLPDSCAYRLLHEGYDLPEWHPLVTGDPNSVHEAGFSIRGMAVSELEWPDPEEWHQLIIVSEE